jgi:transposase
MPPSYVKAYVKRNKNDARDAEACCEAVGRPTMRFVPVKSVEQQGARSIHRARDLLVRQRTQLGNAVRGLLYEMGITAAEGRAGCKALIDRVLAPDLAPDLAQHPAIPAAMLTGLAPLARQWRALEEEVAGLDRAIAQAAKADEAARRLMTIPGVGPVTAHAVVCAIGDGAQFASGRDFAAWVGLTRKNHDTGGKARLTGHISKAGDGALRCLLVLGASSRLRHVRAKPETGRADPTVVWIHGLLARRPVRVAVVAQAAKTARIIWAILRSGQSYRASVAA